LAAPVSVEDQYAAKELGRLINNFLGTLDKQTRMIFVRRYWYADSIADISAQYHMTENNVYVRLSRTRDKLKQYLKKEGFLT
ncbi:MAG: sigma-70 family RNA polymerase sigma factor, partial [Oscillospiraceae bacterium]|nr:sigma-70 family RNA polymerase sigma factor [Oscillospiraceae bacterium]